MKSEDQMPRRRRRGAKAAAAHLPVLNGCGRKGAGDGGFTQGRTRRSASRCSTGAFEGAGDGGFTQVRTWRSGDESCDASEMTRRGTMIAQVRLRLWAADFNTCASACQHAHRSCDEVVAVQSTWLSGFDNYVCAPACQHVHDVSRLPETRWEPRRPPADEELPLRDSRVHVEGKEKAKATKKRRDRPTPAEPPQPLSGSPMWGYEPHVFSRSRNRKRRRRENMSRRVNNVTRRFYCTGDNVQRTHVRTLVDSSNDCGAQAASRLPQHSRSPHSLS